MKSIEIIEVGYLVLLAEVPLELIAADSPRRETDSWRKFGRPVLFPL